jgi:DnaD/phage-associated family protein
MKGGREMSGEDKSKDDSFKVPSSVTEFLADADAVSLRVLLFFLCRQTLDGAGDTLRLSDKQINAAVAFWLEKGVLTLSSGRLSPAVESAGESAVKTVESSVKNVENTPSKPPRTSLPKYSGADMESILKENGQLSYLLATVEKRLGRMLTTAGASTLFALYDHLGLPADVILMLVEYCISTGRRSMREIEKEGLYWADSGIVTHELAERHIAACERKNSALNRIKRLFGIDGRALSKSEREYILRWVEEYRFSDEVISEAYERTVKKTGKLSFAYINSILRSWYEKGYRTLEQACSERKRATPQPSPSGFDYDEYLRICEERLNRN